MAESNVLILGMVNIPSAANVPSIGQEYRDAVRASALAQRGFTVYSTNRQQARYNGTN